jgi:peptidoglycan/xylan/chitin deacetylase (PgdA/CDA1 family)
MLIEQPSSVLQVLYKKALWRRMDGSEKIVYLTFDDGPIPDVTPWVLDVLKNFGIKATFFCVGENVQKYPEIFERIKAEGHSIGSHTFNHFSGFHCNYETYIENVEEANQIIKSEMFRPPHGHLTAKQYRYLKNKYKLIMWDVITRDYNAKLKPEKILNIVKKYTRNGSIIVFHDSLKAEKNMRYAMPKAVEYLLEKGYKFEKL